MKRVFFLALASVCLAGSARAEWIELPWPAVGATLPIWKPDDFDATKRYPAIVYYHGAGGQPNAEFMHQMTGGKDFVLVGMTYRHKGAVEYGEQEIADGLGLLNALKKTLVGSLAVDPERIYVGGFSKGGWHAAMLLDRDRTLAGGMILGSGILAEQGAAPKFTDDTPIYIGCGRFDGNYPQALGAFVYFKKLGAEITFETWPDVGHERPKVDPEGLRQWLKIEGGSGGLKTEAEEWIAERMAEIEGISDPVERWFAYDDFLMLPFVERTGGSAEAKARMEKLLEDPKVAAEKKWRDESRGVLLREGGDRLLKTAQMALRSHERIAAEATGTRAADHAIKDMDRVRELLKNAKVVTLPTKEKPGNLTPERPPSAPSGGPGRGPFFPPGIEVKPAD